AAASALAFGAAPATRPQKTSTRQRATVARDDRRMPRGLISPGESPYVPGPGGDGSGTSSSPDGAGCCGTVGCAPAPGLAHGWSCSGVLGGTGGDCARPGATSRAARSRVTAVAARRPPNTSAAPLTPSHPRPLPSSTT